MAGTEYRKIACNSIDPKWIRSEMAMAIREPRSYELKQGLGADMKFIRIVIALFLFTTAPEAAAQNVAKSHGSSTAPATMTDYAIWLDKLNTASVSGFAEFQQLRPAWDALLNSPKPQAAKASFLARLDAIEQALLRSSREMQGLAPPDTTGLNMPADSEPRVLTASYLEVNTRLLQMARTFRPLAQAVVDRDVKAMQSAIGSMFDAATVVVESKRLMLQASLVTVDRETSDYEQILLRITMYDSGVRTLTGLKRRYRNLPDKTLAADLKVTADAMASLVAKAQAKLEVEIEDTGKEVERLRISGDTDAYQLAIKDQRALPLNRRIYSAGLDYVRTLRAGAANMGSTPDMGAFQGVLAAMSSLEMVILNVIVDQTKIYAGTAD